MSNAQKIRNDRMKTNPNENIFTYVILCCRLAVNKNSVARARKKSITDVFFKNANILLSIVVCALNLNVLNGLSD